MKHLILTAAFLALCSLGMAGPGIDARRHNPAIHYAPAENLEHIDVALIDTARQEIDLAIPAATRRWHSCAVGAFAFGRSRGVVEGVLGACGIPASHPPPPGNAL
jgi:hypothetical protein